MPNPPTTTLARCESPKGYAVRAMGLGKTWRGYLAAAGAAEARAGARATPDGMRVASRLLGEPPATALPWVVPPVARASPPRRGVPSPPSPSGRPRTGSFDYAVVSKPPPPAPILLGSPRRQARRRAAFAAARRRRAPSPRNAPATPTAAARPLAPATPRNWPSPRLRRRPPVSSADAVPYLYDDSDLRPEHASKLEALETAIRLHGARRYGHGGGAPCCSGRTVFISTAAARIVASGGVDRVSWTFHGPRPRRHRLKRTRTPAIAVGRLSHTRRRLPTRSALRRPRPCRLWNC